MYVVSYYYNISPLLASCHNVVIVVLGFYSSITHTNVVLEHTLSFLWLCGSGALVLENIQLTLLRIMDTVILAS